MRRGGTFVVGWLAERCCFLRDFICFLGSKLYIERCRNTDRSREESMSNEEFEKYLAQSRLQLEEFRKDPVAAKDWLVKLGIINASGQLASEFQPKRVAD